MDNQKMLGGKGTLSPIVNNSNIKPLKNSVYEELEEKDYQRIIDEKDQIIRRLEFKVIKLEREKEELMSSNPVSANSFYKKKLQQEIKENQTATQLFLAIGHRMQKLIDLLKLSPQPSEDSSEMKNILKMMGQSPGSDSQNFSMDQGQLQSMDAAQNEVSKKLQELQTVCDQYHKGFSKIQKDFSGIDKKMRQTKKQYEDELMAMQKQSKQLRINKDHFKNLQQKAEQQKKQLLRNIANCLDPKTKKQIEKMSKEELIQYIKKLTYKINEVQIAKSQVIRENKKIKTADLEKYKKMLNEVKQVKEMSRLGGSMM